MSEITIALIRRMIAICESLSVLRVFQISISGALRRER